MECFFLPVLQGLLLTKIALYHHKYVHFLKGLHLPEDRVKSLPIIIITIEHLATRIYMPYIVDFFF